MLFERTIEKKDIDRMPKVVFQGPIHEISSPQEVERAVSFLRTDEVLGIDSETRPSFSKNEKHKVALLQVSSENRCFLFRLNKTGLTYPLILLLEDPEVLKIGLSLHDDFISLRQRAPFTPRGYIELQEYVRSFGIQEMSLQKIYAILFGEKISKSQRLSNWEADVLSLSQRQYAAIDAWACLHIYKKLQCLKSSNRKK